MRRVGGNARYGGDDGESLSPDSLLTGIRGEREKKRKKSKKELRLKSLQARRSLPSDRISADSRTIEEKVISLREFRDAKLLASYVAKEDEVQTRRIIEAALADGKRVAVPLADPKRMRLSFREISSMDELVTGHFDVLEPNPDNAWVVQPSEVDLYLIPVVAWDPRGRRLGYGGGYFDRTLSGVGATKAGLAFESQRVRSIPADGRDMRLDVIVTERRVVRPFEEGKAGRSDQR